MIRAAIVGLALVATPALADDTPHELMLICDGSSMIVTTTDETKVEVENNKGAEASGTASTSALTRIAFQVRFRLSNGAASINIPTGVTGGVQGKNGGWFPVKSLSVTDDAFDGKVQLALFSAPSFHIDRRTGEITTSGGYVGQCVKQNLDQRAF